VNRIAVGLAVIAASTTAAAQVDTRYATEPTDGIALPATPLAGEHDARAVAVNPGGLALLHGSEAAVALDLEDSSYATSEGPGFGAYFASTVGGKILPKLGLGLGLEWLRPPRDQLAPDPGTPFRFTYAYAVSLGSFGGFGVAWHHFIADGPLDGVNTFDLGLSTRWGSRVAIGAALRDLATKPIGGAPVQRRYELEAVVRPLATDRLELAVGGRLGETRLDVDGWARASVRAARGTFVVAQVESRDLHELVDSPTGTIDEGGRELRATVGFALSFGSGGIASYGTGVRDAGGHDHALGGTFVATVSALAPPSVLGHPDHLERVELTGDIGTRALTALVVRLRAIAADPSAKGLVVVFDGVGGGMATIEELRDELAAVRRAGKKVYAYMVAGSGRDYFIASAADKIYIDPAGGLRLVGMSGTLLFFRGVLDLVGVSPQFEKIAEYKSAPEMFTRSGPSDIAGKMHEDMFDSLWDTWLDAVAAGRKLSKQRVRELVDGGPYDAGELARTKELVDAVAPPDKVSELVEADLGGAGYPVEDVGAERPDTWQRPAIAIIYVDGDIVAKKSFAVTQIGQTVTGGESIVKAIEAARADPRVGAIVLRVNSPGGEVLPSELIAREVFQTRGVKPIICSMGDLAASGGYFVSAGCETIFAEPMTITGSIGIYTGKFDLSGLLGKLGVATATYTRGQHAAIESSFRPFTPDERALVMRELEYSYGRFVNAVAEGRKLSRDQVDTIGRGHVYTGAQAKPIHLVDRLGGLGDALVEAKRRMGLDADADVQLVEMPELPTGLVEVVTTLLGADATAARDPLLALPLVRELLRAVPASLVLAPDALQARLPYDISFQ
jgi:protease-4